MDLSSLMKNILNNLSIPFPFLLNNTSTSTTPPATVSKEPESPVVPPPLLAATNLVSLDIFRSFGSPPVGRATRTGARSESGCVLPLFRPYVAKVPWHGGARAFLSQLFPRYGHYCGPNWSSGKDGGSALWDQRPIDWLDLCCYCHDIGYDTYDQAKLLKADLAFLECLERPRMQTKGNALAAELYRSMCIAGLKNILIPYRMQLVRLQGQQQTVLDTMDNLIGKRAGCGRDLYR